MAIEIYTDGSATVSTKPGGWAFVIVTDGKVVLEGSGKVENSTNNDMEMQAIIEGLRAAHKLRLPSFKLFSDSQIALNWASGKARFKQKNKIDKYSELRSLVSLTKVSLSWVKGHSGNKYNDMCDKLANAARTGSLKTKAIKPKKTKAVYRWNDAKRGLSLKQKLVGHLSGIGSISSHELMEIVLEIMENLEK